MTRRVFFSFHYKPDNWRAAKVRNMGVIEGNKPVTDNAWEEVTKGGDKAIQNWIDDQIKGKSCTVVLIGAKTAERKWIKYEIKKSWDDGKGVLGIYIHYIEDAPVPPASTGEQSSKGKNPFDDFTVGHDKKELSSIVKAYDPPYRSSKGVYDYIKKNMADWVEKAIEIRDDFKEES